MPPTEGGKGINRQTEAGRQSSCGNGFFDQLRLELLNVPLPR
jgi:hypothetical protein